MSPIDKYFKGGGEKVMKNMVKEYGPSKGKSVFYATANKTGMKPKVPKPSVKVPKPSLESPTAGMRLKGAGKDTFFKRSKLPS